MKGLCPYREMFGKPGQGIHAYRLFHIAVVDVLLTLIGAWIASKVFRVPLVYTACALFSLGIVCHRIFCVRTTVDTWLFPDPNSSRAGDAGISRKWV